jgi:hypothetical protein
MNLQHVSHIQNDKSSALAVSPWLSHGFSIRPPCDGPSLTSVSLLPCFGHLSRVISPDPSRHCLIRKSSPRVQYLHIIRACLVNTFHLLRTRAWRIEKDIARCTLKQHLQARQQRLHKSCTVEYRQVLMQMRWRYGAECVL